MPGRPADLAGIVDWTAAELSCAIRDRVVSCVEVMTAYLDHIERINPRVNAIVALRPRQELLAEAAAKDDLLDQGQRQGWMHGFPHAVKDLADVAGMATTAGFFRPPFPAPVATTDELFVERLRRAGAIFIGRTNTPEFGLGSHTYNQVYGVTGNAYDPTRSAGGSSGGAAVAVALRMVPVADGSDFMGSLRNPPGWNNVLGLRPSVGRVPSGGPELFCSHGGVEGPIARTATDLAMLLRTMAGYDARSPLSLDPGAVAGPAEVALRTGRVAWLGDLGGYLPMEPDVLRVTSAAMADFERLGFEVTTLDELPRAGTFRGNQNLWPTWLTYRHWLVGSGLAALYEEPAMRALLKPEAIFEVEGLLRGPDDSGPLSALDVFRASVRRSDLYLAFQSLFETHDFAVLPTAQVMPFAVEETWPREIQGVPMSSYHRWMEVTAIGTLINAPTLALPAGFSDDGLPIGLQVIGPHHADAALLALALAWEQQTQWVQRRPPPMLG